MSQQLEILDLYDSEFRKTNKTIIRRVDEIPEGVNIMLSYALIKNNGKYLLEQSTARNDFKYAIPGGHVLSGEDALTGLKRELKEELNITDVKIKHIDTIKFPYNSYIFNVYLIEDDIDIDNLSFQKEEVTTIGWFSKDEILKLIDEDKIPRGYAFILKEYI